MAATIDLAEVRVTVGVDTHADVHVAAAIDQHGRLLGMTSVPSTATGHADLTAWAQQLGAIDQVGIEGPGSYGAGLTRHLLEKGISVVEVVRPNRQTRRRRRKTDAIDAETAAPSVLAGTALGMPKTGGGNRDANRALYVLAPGRLSYDERTRGYAARRTAEGKTRREIIRCLKHYPAREVFRGLTADGQTAVRSAGAPDLAHEHRPDAVPGPDIPGDRARSGAHV